MIRKMTKYSFILLSGEKEEFLNRLGELGVMDITRSSKTIDEKSAQMLDLSSRYKRAIDSISSVNYTKDPDFDDISKKAAAVNIATSDMLATYEKTSEAIPETAARIKDLEKEITANEVWGEYEKSQIRKIEDLGYELHFFCTSAKSYNPKWEEEFIIQIIRSDADVWFVILTPKGTSPKYPARELAAPSRPAAEAKAELAETTEKLKGLKATIQALKNNIDALKQKYSQSVSELDMYLANNAGESAAEEHITILEGFAPVEQRKDIESFLDTQDVYYISEDAKEEDNPPIKLKNNWFARMFEPIGSMYMLPTYGELDLTPYFAPFYMLFFGLCVGDMGYGLLLILIGVLIHFKMPKMSSIGTLVALLGAGSTIMPLLNGTFFGAKLYDILPMSDKIKGMFLNDMQMFWFALIFGIVHLVVARIVNGVYQTIRHGWQAGLSNFGWAAFIIWVAMFFAEWNSKGEIKIMSPALSYTLLGIAGVGILFFSNLSRNIFIRLFKGVAAVYDVTGLLGDVLSYIRLFGLGMSGGILGMVFNSMAFQLSDIPYVGWLLTVLLLLFGHSLTIFISCLGAFVHPMRLTFVEFYKNAGFEGGGRPYRPLSNKNNE